MYEFGIKSIRSRAHTALEATLRFALSAVSEVRNGRDDVVTCRVATYVFNALRHQKKNDHNVVKTRARLAQSVASLLSVL